MILHFYFEQVELNENTGTRGWEQSAVYRKSLKLLTENVRWTNLFSVLEGQVRTSRPRAVVKHKLGPRRMDESINGNRDVCM